MQNPTESGPGQTRERVRSGPWHWPEIEYKVATPRAATASVCHTASDQTIDSTLLPLKKDMLLLNASRITSADRLPKFLRQHRKIWVQDCVPGEFHNFPYASKWIGMNVLSINEDTVMVDSIQKDLIDQLKREGFDVVDCPITHSRTLGGGHHCVTCDLERE